MDYWVEVLMSKIPYTYLLILLISYPFYQLIWFGILCSVLTSLVMWFVYRWRLRKLARAMRIRCDERLAERTRIAHARHDTLLQTIEAGKYVADDALERPNDMAHMRGALEKLSRWLGQATQEAQQALKSLAGSTLEKHDD
jgi:signal transduction histidine kinase